LFRVRDVWAKRSEEKRKLQIEFMIAAKHRRLKKLADLNVLSTIVWFEGLKAQGASFMVSG
jgi:hypothetical protein